MAMEMSCGMPMIAAVTRHATTMHCIISRGSWGISRVLVLLFVWYIRTSLPCRPGERLQCAQASLAEVDQAYGLPVTLVLSTPKRGKEGATHGAISRSGNS